MDTNAGITTRPITLPDQLELVARNGGQLTLENIEGLLRQQLENGSKPGTAPEMDAWNVVPTDVVALERLIEIAEGDTG